MPLLSWDIVFWKTKSVEYVPSIWASSSSDSYKWPVYTTKDELKILVDTCNDLKHHKFKYFKGEGKTLNIKKLKEAKRLCAKAAYTSAYEDSSSDANECDDSLTQNMKKSKTLCAKPAHTSACEDSSSEANECDDSFTQNNTSRIDNTPSHINIADKQPSISDEQPINIMTDAQKTDDSIDISNIPSTANNVNSSEVMNFQIKLEEMDKKFSRKLGSMKYDLQKLEKNDNEIKDFLQRLLKINATSLSVDDEDDGTSSVNKQVYELLPISTIEEVANCEEMLKDETFRNAFVDHLYLLGGKTAHKCIYLQLAKLMHPNLTLQYSGIGKKGKLPFNILRLFSTVRDATRKRFPTTEELEIRKSVSLFLAGAKERLKKYKDN